MNAIMKWERIMTMFVELTSLNDKIIQEYVYIYIYIQNL